MRYLLLSSLLLVGCSKKLYVVNTPIGLAICEKADIDVAKDCVSQTGLTIKKIIAPTNVIELDADEGK